MSREELQAQATRDAEPWKNSPYYEGSEASANVFWNEGTLFRRLFEKLTLGHVIDLACGHGKQSQYIFDKCQRLYLIDILQDNIDACRARYKDATDIEYIVTNGFEFPSIEDGTVDSIFCYDAMVHFSPEVVGAYLKESSRVLKRNGRGLFHHSNLAQPPSENYGNNPHGRNRMSAQLFAEYAAEAGFIVLEQYVFPWGHVSDLDCLSLVQR